MQRLLHARALRHILHNADRKTAGRVILMLAQRGNRPNLQIQNAAQKRVLALVFGGLKRGHARVSALQKQAQIAGIIRAMRVQQIVQRYAFDMRDIAEMPRFDGAIRPDNPHVRVKQADDMRERIGGHFPFLLRKLDLRQRLRQRLFRADALGNFRGQASVLRF